MFNLNEFLSQVNNTGILKRNYFYTIINIPQSLLTGGNDNTYLRLMCFGLTLPGAFFSTKSGYMRYGYGRKEKFPTSPVFDDTSFSFYLDNQGIINNIFSNWLNLVSNFDANNLYKSGFYEMSYKKDGDQYNYVTDIDIFICNENGNEVIQYTLYEAWPIATDNIQYDWNSTDQIAQYNCTFTFKDWSTRTYQNPSLTSFGELGQYLNFNTVSNLFTNFPQSIGDIQNQIFNRSLFNNGLNVNLDVGSSLFRF